jgi:hypothetical protein
MLNPEIKIAAIVISNNVEEVARCLWQQVADKNAIAYYRRQYRVASITTSDAIADVAIAVHLILTMAIGLREWLQRQDHEIPILETDLKPIPKPQKMLPPAPSPIALLSPAKVTKAVSKKQKSPVSKNKKKPNKPKKQVCQMSHLGQ